MTAIFLKILNMSISAGWLILAVMILRFVLKKAPKWIFCILWGMVAVRLIFPPMFESSWSLIPSAETISPSTVQYAQNPTINSGIPSINQVLNPVISKTFEANPAASVNPLYIWSFFAGIIWIIGFVILLCYALISYLRLYRKVQESVFFRENIRLCDAVGSPFILGIIKPHIYLSSSLNEQQINYVTAHEQAHLSRKDHWWKPLAFLLLSIYWFHPLVWAAYVLFCRDIELACDEKVINDFNIAEKKSYAKALLACSVHRKIVFSCPLAFGEIGIKERVKSILNYRKPRFWMMITAVTACVILAVCFLTNPLRESMIWAKNLSAEDVESIELVVMPQSSDKQYRLFHADEIKEIVSLIHESHGRYIANPEPLTGGSITFYIHMKDGTRHTFSSDGNMYLHIDEDCYDAGYDWLSSWPYEAGDSTLPEDFFGFLP